MKKEEQQEVKKEDDYSSYPTKVILYPAPRPTHSTEQVLLSPPAEIQKGEFIDKSDLIQKAKGEGEKKRTEESVPTLELPFSLTNRSPGNPLKKEEKDGKQDEAKSTKKMEKKDGKGEEVEDTKKTEEKKEAKPQESKKGKEEKAGSPPKISTENKRTEDAIPFTEEEVAEMEEQYKEPSYWKTHSRILRKHPDFTISKDIVVIKKRYDLLIIIYLDTKGKTTHCLKINSLLCPVFEASWSGRRKAEYEVGQKFKGCNYFVQYSEFEYTQEEKLPQSELLMNYCGEPLSRFSFSNKELYGVAVKLVEAFMIAHKKEIFISDIKPENIMFNRELKIPVVIDFDVSNNFSSLHLLTFSIKTATRGRSPEFCPPEFIELRDNFAVKEDEICIPSKIDVFGFAMSFLYILNKSDQGWLTRQQNNRQKGKESYENLFLKEVKQLKLDERKKSPELNCLLDMIAACTEFNPLTRPSFEYLHEILSKKPYGPFPRCTGCRRCEASLTPSGKEEFCRDCMELEKTIAEVKISGKMPVVVPRSTKGSSDAISEKDRSLIEGAILRSNILGTQEKPKEALICCDIALSIIENMKIEFVSCYNILIMTRKITYLMNNGDTKSSKECAEMLENTIIQSFKGKENEDRSAQRGLFLLFWANFAVGKFATLRANSKTLEMIKKNLEMQKGIGRESYVEHMHLGRWYYFMAQYPESQDEIRIAEKKMLEQYPGKTIFELCSQGLLNEQHVQEIFSLKAYILERIGPLSEAKSAFDEFQQIVEIIRGTTSIRFLNARRLYAHIIGEAGEYKPAKTILEDLKKKFANIEADAPLSKARIYIELGVLFQEQGKYKKAIANFKECIRLRLIKKKDNLAEVAQAYNWNGRCHYDYGNYKKAIKYATQALRIRKKLFGLKHAYTHQSLCLRARTYRAMGKYDKAKKYLEKVFSSDKTFDEDKVNMDNTTPIYVWGVLLGRMKNVEKSIDYLQKATKFLHKRYKEPHILASEIGIEYGYALSLKNLKEGEAQIQRELDDIMKTKLPNHPVRGIGSVYLGMIKHKLGERHKGIDLVKEGCSILEQKCGKDHCILTMAKDWLSKL